MIHKWPDGTRKSMHNAFNWRQNAEGILLPPPPTQATIEQKAHRVHRKSTTPKEKS